MSEGGRRKREKESEQWREGGERKREEGRGDR